MKFKSIFTVVIASMLICGLAGCSKNASESAAGGSEASVSETVQKEVTAEELAQAALAACDFPEMVKATEPQDILNHGCFIVDENLGSGGMHVDSEDYAVYYSKDEFEVGKSDHVVVVKPIDDNEDNIQGVLEYRLNCINGLYNKTDDQLKANEGAVLGRTDNGYFYLIVNKDGKKAESALLEALK